jgi:tRNA threonylcarbamoyl adenosine modification protein (Sua5/YciO/YrdC/YwlC family)
MILRINESNINTSEIMKVAAVLRSGGVIIYPTDTVYALGCDMMNSRAIERICRLKGIRPEKSHFSFVCSDLSHLSQFTRPIPNHIFRIMKKALPGPYTFILEANNEVPKLLKQNKKTVGIRVPDNNVCKAIVMELGHPLISSSLIDSEDDVTEYYTDPDIIHDQFGDKVDLVIDAGFGDLTPSTVIDCSKEQIEVIREGQGSLDVLG